MIDNKCGVSGSKTAADFGWEGGWLGRARDRGEGWVMGSGLGLALNWLTAASGGRAEAGTG